MSEPLIFEYKQINHIANKILSGYAAVVETDTVIGIIAKDPNLIYKLKKRDLSKPLITFVSHPVNTNNLVAKDLMKKYWPGALTLIIDGKSYRQPDHRFLQKVLNLTGPLYSSSCNRSGEEPVIQSIDAKEIFKNHFDKVIFVRGHQRDKMPSTIYDCDKKQIVRQGKIII